jgi:hypothetical protein
MSSPNFNTLIAKRIRSIADDIEDRFSKEARLMNILVPFGGIEGGIEILRLVNGKIDEWDEILLSISNIIPNIKLSSSISTAAANEIKHVYNIKGKGVKMKT